MPMNQESADVPYDHDLPHDGCGCLECLQARVEDAEAAAEIFKRAVQNREDKIDLLEGGIEAVLRLADGYSHDHSGATANPSGVNAAIHFAVIASRLEDLLP